MSRRVSADKKKLVERLQKMPIVEIACKQSGVPRSTYYRWRQSDVEFANQCDEAIALSTESINDLAESQLIAAIKDKNISAIIFWLKHRNKNYATRINIAGAIRHENAPMTVEQEQILDQALMMAGLSKPKGVGDEEAIERRNNKKTKN